MSRVEVRDLGEPEAVVSYPLGTSSQVHLAQTVEHELFAATPPTGA
jgi:hypothetical protein